MSQPQWALPPQAPAPQYAPPQYPTVQPQQPQYQAFAPSAPAPQFAPQPQYAPQQFAPQPYTPPAQALPPGSLNAFMDQPKVGRPNSISWKGAPDGSTIAGVVAADPTDRDVVVDTDPQTKAIKTYRDGSPRYVLVLTLQLPGPTAAFPDGQASLYCRGNLWEDLQTAAVAAGRANGLPKAGDHLSITLVERKPGRGTIPRNIFKVSLTPGEPGGTAPQQPSAPAYQQPPVPTQLPAQPVPQPQQMAPAQDPWAQQAPTPPAQGVQMPAPIPPAPGANGQAQAQPQEQPQQPAQQPQMPQLDAAQAALLQQFMAAQQQGVTQ